MINLEFKKKFKKLKKKPKYILTNLFPKHESFRFRTAKKDVKKYVNTFTVNLKKIKNINNILEKELYIIYLVKFININMKTYSYVYGNRKNI